MTGRVWLQNACRRSKQVRCIDSEQLTDERSLLRQACLFEQADHCANWQQSKRDGQWGVESGPSERCELSEEHLLLPLRLLWHCRTHRTSAASKSKFTTASLSSR